MGDPTSSPYRYSQLGTLPPDSQAAATRLLTIQPGAKDEGICIDLHDVILRERDGCSFEALSYVWGSKEDPAFIYSGTEKKFTLPVTRNLASALQHLRYVDRPRTMWIDALSIDQSNLDERGRQVGKMSLIYRLASRVVIWLGPQENDSTRALEALSDRNLLSFAIGPGEEEPHPSTPEYEDFWTKRWRHLNWDDRTLEAISYLIKREWFDRLWVRQEIYWDHDLDIILCGDQILLWKMFTRAISCITTLEYKTGVFRDWYGPNANRMAYVEDVVLSHSKRVSLLTLQDRFGDCSCTDPRDRIYGVLSMCAPAEQALVQSPDYRMPTEEVYRSLVLQYFTILNDLTIICQCPNPRLTRPTWVPDWASRVPRTSHGFTASQLPLLHRASGCLSPHFEVLPGDVLRVAGCTIGKVESVKPMRLGTLKDQEAEWQHIEELMPKDLFDRQYPLGGTFLEAFISTLACGDFQDAWLPTHSSTPSLDEAAAVFEAIVSPEDREWGPGQRTIAWNYLATCCRYAAGRSLFHTDEGYIGSGPQHMMPEDRVCLLMGCDKPVVLRSIPDIGIVLIGECYIHGYMSGEAFFGPLPQDWRAVIRYISDTERGFFNAKTGTFQVEDPRLASFPDADDQFAEARTYWADGRNVKLDLPPNAEVWETRGLAMELFDVR